MNRAILLISCFLIVSVGRAQQREIDSTSRELISHTQVDTVRWLLFNDLAYYYQFIDPAKGVMYADSALGVAKQLNRLTAIAGAYSSKAMNYHAMNKDTLAIATYRQAMSIHEQAKNNPGVASACNNIAIVYADISEYANALIYHEKALEIFRQLKLDQRAAGSYNNMGVVYMYLADMPKAMDCYVHALAIYEQQGDKNSIGNAYTNIGIIKKNLKDFSESIAYHKKAEAIFEQAGNDYLLANVIGNIGVTYDAANDTLQAIKYYTQAITLCGKVKNKHGLANNLANIAILYRGLKNYNGANDYLKKAAKIYEDIDDKNGMSVALGQLGSLYAEAPLSFLKQIGISPEYRYLASLVNFQKALQLAKQIGALDRQAEILHQMSKTYEQSGDYQQALNTFRDYTALEDSILSDEKIKEVTRKEMQFNAEKKEALINAGYDAKLKQQKTARNAVMLITGILLLGAITSFVFYKRNRDATARRKEAELNAEISDTAMKALRAQMNPHFLFNSLNSISNYITRNDIPAADGYLVKFSKLMRMILENSEEKQVSLTRDLQALSMYMELESLRMKHPFIYEITVDDAVDPDNTLVPPLILQPFVENSIWHGIAKKDGPGKIFVAIMKDGNMLNCIVEDDGAGRGAANAAGAGKSMGMKITKQRIDIINKVKKSSGEILVSDLNPGTRVEVKLPLEVNF